MGKKGRDKVCRVEGSGKGGDNWKGNGKIKEDAREKSKDEGSVKWE